MEMTDPSLGMFCLLPAEVRRMIWKYLSPQLHVGRSLPRKPNCLSQCQEILLASRKIHAEVAAEVPSGYNGDKIVISIKPEYQYKVWIRTGNTNGVYWDIEDLPNAISRGFGVLPWHNLNVRIWIWAPDKEDSGQIICLYKKVRDLVEILKGAKGFLSLRVVFRDTKKTSWFDDAQPQCSMPSLAVQLPWYEGRPWVKYDFDFILAQFLQIQNVKLARVYSTDMFGGKRENPITSKMFMKVQRYMKETTPFELQAGLCRVNRVRIKKYIQLLFVAVERTLDLLPSQTANLLRLHRFSHWYTNRLHGNSPYENELVGVLLNHVLGYDTLQKMNDRYRIMRAHNPLSLAYRAAFPETFDSAKHPDIDARGWNRDIWHCVYKDGILPLTSKESKDVYRKWAMEDDAPENDGEFVRLHNFFHLLIGINPSI